MSISVVSSDEELQELQDGKRCLESSDPVHPVPEVLEDVSSAWSTSTSEARPKFSAAKQTKLTFGTQGPSNGAVDPAKRRWKKDVLKPERGAPSRTGDSNKENLSRPKKGTKRPLIPSFLFQEAQSSSVSETPQEVEVFMTVAGRQDKGGSVTRQVTLEEMEKFVPVSFVPQLLPQALADHFLRSFQQEAKMWHTSKRWLYEKEIESHRVESGFRFNDLGVTSTSRWESSGFGDDLRYLRGQVITAVQRARAQLRRQWRAAASSAGSCDSRPLTKEELAQETVALASRGQRLSAKSIEWLVRYAASSYALKAWRWEPNFCVANLYRDQEDFLGAHSDPVELIGPWAIVASVTFGAARQFRMKPVAQIATEREGGGRITSFSIRLPHNSLLVCWEGFQEFWRHEVPKDKGLTSHSISGPARLNFTFRKSVGAVAARKPMCHCGRKADLKPVLKASENRGRYFWSCRNPRVKKGTYRTCDFFKWDDELLRAKDAKDSTAPLPNALSRVVVAGSAGSQSASHQCSLAPGAL